MRADEQQHKDALDAAGLRLTLGHHPFSLEDVRRTVEQAVRLKADFRVRPAAPPLRASLGGRPVSARSAPRSPTDQGMTFFVETHRNNIPESLNQALQLVERMPGDPLHR